MRIATAIYKKRFLFLFLGILFLVYWTNTFHTNFPDEFDNIVGGWYIKQGKLPYIGFFSHHNPGAYFISAFITLFSDRSFVAFRMYWAALLFIAAGGSWWILKKLLGKQDLKFYGIYLLLAAVSATYIWGHMMLSETVVAYSLIPAYTLILLKSLYDQPLSLMDLIFISGAIFIAVFTSLTFAFAALILLFYTAYRYILQHIHKDTFSLKMMKKFGYQIFVLSLIFGLPYLLFLLYLLVTGSLSEYVFQSIVYNRDYYIYNFPKVAGIVSTNPFRYAISILYNTSIQFHSLLVQVRNFNFSYPETIALLLANVGVIIFLLTKRKFLLATVVYLFLVFLNARSEPLNFKETDFHSTVYILTSLFHLAFILYVWFQSLNEKLHQGISLIYKFLFIVVGIYGFFLTIFFGRAYIEKVYARFMGQAPGIYDTPVVAPIINKIVSREEYFWIGPFEFQELLYINGRQPSKYHWFLPANARSEKIKNEITRDLHKNRPKLIVFKEDYSTFGVTPEQFNKTIVDILRADYFRITDLNAEGDHFEVLVKGLHNFDIEQNFYFSKELKQEIIETLLKVGIIAKVL